MTHTPPEEPEITITPEEPVWRDARFVRAPSAPLAGVLGALSAVVVVATATLFLWLLGAP